MGKATKSPISVYSEVAQSAQDEEEVEGEEKPTSSHHHIHETSPFLPQHDKLPNSIQSVPIALAPTILPLTYNPNKKPAKKNHWRRIVAPVLGFLLMAALIHWIVWLCLKDKDMSLMQFMLNN